MQTPKASRSVSVEVSPRMSSSKQAFQKSSTSSNRTARSLKIARPGSDLEASPNSISRTPKKINRKVLERGSPRSPMSEKKRISKSPELEAQISQLEDELKKAKDQLNVSETLKRRAQQEADETKKQLVAISERLDESQQQLVEFSTSEDARVQELRKLSQERDKVWQSELEAIQKQHSMDSSALASALNEIQKLKRQLEMVADSEAKQCRHAETAHEEIENLRVELSETVSLVESMREQISVCKGSEARALQGAREAQVQLEEAMTIAESLRLEGLKAKEVNSDLTLQLKRTKEKASSLETLMRKLEEQLKNTSRKSPHASQQIMLEQDDNDVKEEASAEKFELQTEIGALKAEVTQLKSALEESEHRYQEEYIHSTLQIRSAFDQVEQAKLEAVSRETELEAELKKARIAIDELSSELMSRETMSHDTSTNIKKLSSKIKENGSSPDTSELEIELKKVKGDLQDLMAVLMDKETQLQRSMVENETLKAETRKREGDESKAREEAFVSVEAKAGEEEALVKLRNATEEADESCRKAARVAEQLNAAQTANTELEAELRRLKIQSDQWRKAAEAAAAMLSTGNNGKFVDRTISLDSSYNASAINVDSPFSDDLDDDSPKKKNGNMLKKIGVLWKKGPK